MRTRTKIICTIGPAVATFEKMVALIHAGMDVARLNFSHGTHKEHLESLRNLKRARQETGRPLAIMVDTQGPEIRLGKVKGDSLPLKKGQTIRLGAGGDTDSLISLHPPEIIPTLRAGTRVLFDDGYIEGVIGDNREGIVTIEIQNEGVLKSGKKMNLPGMEVPLPSMTSKDVEDIKFACAHDVEYIAASFVRSPQHILSIQELLAKQGKKEILVIAKIESAQGVEHLDAIVKVADGIMIARGDLGVELDLALVPKLQKRMIRSCFQACKPSITATQMLESMIVHSRPTRAEASDVANAIYDSTSCIMLSGETAVGSYPIETVERMRRIAEVAEEDFDYRAFFKAHSEQDYPDLSSAVALAAVRTAYSVGAKAIFALTASGVTARLVSRLRPEMPIVAATPSRYTYHQLALNWGVRPLFVDTFDNAKEAFQTASRLSLKQGIVSPGDTVVVTAGVPFGQKGSTNMMWVESVEALT
jgi:pyruvate kinase